MSRLANSNGQFSLFAGALSGEHREGCGKFLPKLNQLVKIGGVVPTGIRCMQGFGSSEDLTTSTTDFGYKAIPLSEKTEQVAAVFHSVAASYDLMNDLMSWGVHRLWKKFTLAVSQTCLGDKVLDVAGGTGDLTQAFSKRVGERGHVTLLDINATMLQCARNRLLDEGCIDNCQVLQANAEALPFADDYFDCLSIAFGLRNITHKMAALQSMYRVLKPGSPLLVLEFSKPVLAPLRTLYERYSFDFIPKLGQWIAKDTVSYQYLVESIRCHPDQKSLKSFILEAGFDHCEYYNLSGGIVALHRAWKF